MSITSLNLTPANPNSCLARSRMAEITFSCEGFMLASCTAALISASSSFWDFPARTTTRARDPDARVALDPRRVATAAVARTTVADMARAR